MKLAYFFIILATFNSGIHAADPFTTPLSLGLPDQSQVATTQQQSPSKLDACSALFLKKGQGKLKRSASAESVAVKRTQDHHGRPLPAPHAVKTVAGGGAAPAPAAEPDQCDEILGLMKEVARRIERDLKKLEAQSQKTKQSAHDALTGLARVQKHVAIIAQNPATTTPNSGWSTSTVVAALAAGSLAGAAAHRAQCIIL
jgi:hypothetical protein